MGAHVKQASWFHYSAEVALPGLRLSVWYYCWDIGSVIEDKFLIFLRLYWLRNCKAGYFGCDGWLAAAGRRGV